MNLDRIAVDIRNRTQWEAMDLGIPLIRNYWKPIYLSWIMVTLPVVIMLCLFFPGYSWVPILIIWWLKPLFDRFPLYFMSRTFFNETPKFVQAIKELPCFIFKNLLFDLTIFRFSPWRSLVMPVKHLENLKVKQRIKRIKVLAGNVRGWATLLTTLCFLFELGLFLGWYFLLYILFMKYIINPCDIFTKTGLLEFYFHVLFYYISFSVVEPVYVAGGFSLYINRRVFLEGWDIELVFRHMKKRCNLNGEGKKVQNE
jgi:hypothetical protein